ncbi:MAG: RNA ligase family protein [Armatimonadetes bacterium]|nr:RNA ligase family protein [Armatimonadota bacterium]
MPLTPRKFPRIRHLPWSEGVTEGDLLLSDPSIFAGSEVVVTEKLDGENRTLARDFTHARSPGDSDRTPTLRAARSHVRALHGRVAHLIPPDLRIVGEDLYARHSIAYRLPALFFVFAAVEGDTVLPWEATLTYAALLELPHVPVLYRGPWDEAAVRGCYRRAPTPWSSEPEGYVARVVDGFTYDQAGFDQSIAKFVRAGHVQTDEHWMHGALVRNELDPGVAQRGTREPW